MRGEDNIVDGKGTDQEHARQMLLNLCDRGFGGDPGEASLVLGRPAEELQQILNGQMHVDDDLAMKVRGIANTRNIDIE
jgi:hypothetical protein